MSPERYKARWTMAPGSDGEERGIPYAELEASAVREPGSDRLWLLHRKLFNMVMRSDAAGFQHEVADPDHKVPVRRE